MTFFREVENENDLFFLGCFKPTWLDLESITLNILDPPPNLAKVRETVFGPGPGPTPKIHQSSGDHGTKALESSGWMAKNRYLFWKAR